MKTKPKMIRQGDVMLMPIAAKAVTKKHTEVARDGDGALVLQHGEVTGHRHRIIETNVCMLRSDVASDPIILRVLGDSAVDLIHEEHGTISIAPGNYSVIIQEEWSDGAWEQVID